MSKNVAEIFLENNPKLTHAITKPGARNSAPYVASKETPVRIRDLTTPLLTKQNQLQNTTIQFLDDLSQVLEEIKLSHTQLQDKFDTLTSAVTDLGVKHEAHTITVAGSIEGVAKDVDSGLQLHVKDVNKGLQALNSVGQQQRDDITRALQSLRSHYDHVYQNIVDSSEALRTYQDKSTWTMESNLATFSEQNTKLTDALVHEVDVLRHTQKELTGQLQALQQAVGDSSAAQESRLSSALSKMLLIQVDLSKTFHSTVKQSQSDILNNFKELIDEQTTVVGNYQKICIDTIKRAVRAVEEISVQQQAEYKKQEVASQGFQNALLQRLDTLTVTMVDMLGKQKHMLEYFVELTDTLNAKRVAVQCSLCSKKVMKYVTTPDGKQVCNNCEG